MPESSSSSSTIKSDQLLSMSQKNVLAQGGLRRSHSQQGIQRSNSLDRDESSLRNEARKRPREDYNAEIKVTDTSKVAVYSREAFKNFGKNWEKKLQEPEKMLHRSFKADEEAIGRSGKQTVSVQTAIGDQIAALLENKNLPHVVAVIEGKSTTDAFNINDDAGKIGYKKIKFVEGLNSSGNTDHKQSMSFYVRADLENAYKVKPVDIDHNGNPIPCMSIRYSTKDGKNYESLVVHIPNQYVGSHESDLNVDNSFQNYATQQYQKDQTIVTSYFGDTNFSHPITENSTPSVGGILSNGSTARMTSSSAKKDTYFMQSVPLEVRESHAVLQPSVLNHVIIDNSGTDNREATDHPSMMHYVVHDSDIVGREPEKLNHYYQSLNS